ncbi:MAG: NAD-dependent deacylase [Gudongella sp.]|jgi:NAD-dependent deacetylase|nr:NAD-dependent deacylase [Gudongella sp.]
METYNVELLKDYIKKSKYTVVLTGAGMSTESGLSDFRSRNGIWKKYDPMVVATKNAIISDYDTFHEFYSLRRSANEEKKPHKGHYILAEWEKRGLVQTIITQNVDTFHTDAGTKNLISLHGSINRYKCDSCGRETDRDRFMRKDKCEYCGGKLRPDIVLFGESLPENELERAITESEKADLFIVIGTSLTVYPAGNLPFRSNGHKVYINDVNESRKKFDLVILGKAGEILSEVDRLLNI